MRKRLAVALLSLSIVVAGSVTLVKEARATHSCEPKAGCAPGKATHENGWDVCTYSCNW